MGSESERTVTTTRVFLVPALMAEWVLPLAAQLKPIDLPVTGLPVILPNEVVTISRFGVSPANIVRTEGTFVLFIENLLVDQAETFSLMLAGAPASLADLVTHSPKHRTSIPLNLLPGKYRLQLKKRADLSIDIVINAK